MTPQPEQSAREQIDRMLVTAGWAVQDAKAVNLYAKQGVAIGGGHWDQIFDVDKYVTNEDLTHNFPVAVKEVLFLDSIGACSHYNDICRPRPA